MVAKCFLGGKFVCVLSKELLNLELALTFAGQPSVEKLIKVKLGWALQMVYTKNIENLQVLGEYIISVSAKPC